MAVFDRQLLAQWVAQRDADAFGALVVRHLPMVYGTCRRILGDASEAEGVAQECFEILAERASTRVGGYLGAWLHRVATNRALSRLRSDARRKAREGHCASAARSEDRAAPDDLAGGGTSTVMSITPWRSCRSVTAAR